MEIELKFQVPVERRAALLRAVSTATARTTRLQAVYADTPDLRLAGAGMALRLRKEGRVWVQTLKGRGDDLMTRLEHEVRLPAQAGAPVLDPLRHADSPAGTALLALLAEGADLAPLYRTDIRRVHRRVRFGGATVELAYDRGQILAGAARLPVDEIEFELLSGPPAALAALAQRWVARFGLWWDGRTKSERGYRLALEQTSVPAVKAKRVAWSPQADTRAVWQSSLQSALTQALANAAEIGGGQGGPDHLHQLRVGLRRLRSVLRELAPWSGDAEASRALELAWRAPFAALGAARDADVMAALQPRLLAAGAPQASWPAGDLAPLPETVVRGAEFNTLMLRSLALSLAPTGLDAGAGPEAPVTLDATGTAALVPPSQGERALPTRTVAERPPANAFTRPLTEAAREVLRQAWRRVRADAAGFAQADIDRQHRTRKRLKRLRYTFECLLPLYPRKPARCLLRAVLRALDALGELNDLQTAEALWRQSAVQEPAAWFAVGWLAAQRERATQAAVAELAGLMKAPRPWRRG